jgi:hypothetical protein
MNVHEYLERLGKVKQAIWWYQQESFALVESLEGALNEVYGQIK